MLLMKEFIAGQTLQVANGFCKLPPVNDAIERYLRELEKKEA